MAGRLDRKVTFQRATAGAADGFNEKTLVWADLTQAWAERLDVSDREQVAAGADIGVRLVRWRVPSNAVTRTLTVNDRLLADGQTWNIKGVKEAATGRFRLIEVTAAVASGA